MSYSYGYVKNPQPSPNRSPLPTLWRMIENNTLSPQSLLDVNDEWTAAYLSHIRKDILVETLQLASELLFEKQRVIDSIEDQVDELKEENMTLGS